MIKEDFTGRVFNRWTVLEFGGVNRKGNRVWKCRCSCGTERFIPTNRLKNNLINSCGCLQREVARQFGRNNLKDLKGRKFGNLTVLERIDNPKQKTTNSVWKCLCDCGKLTEVVSNNLGKSSRSCGCQRVSLMNSSKEKTNLVKNNDPYLNTRYAHCRTTARHRKLNFELTKLDVYDLITKECFYCGKLEIEESIKREFLKARGQTDSNLVKPTNGIDRIDSSKGYIKDNVRSCCSLCNQAKMQLTEEKFYDLVKRQYVNLKKKGLITD